MPAPTMPPMTIMVASKSPRRRARPRAEESGSESGDSDLFFSGTLTNGSARKLDAFPQVRGAKRTLSFSLSAADRLRQGNPSAAMSIRKVCLLRDDSPGSGAHRLKSVLLNPGGAGGRLTK